MGVILFFLLMQQGDMFPSAKYYVYLKGTGELEIKVSIWGEVAATGLFSIPDDTDIATLLSLAGGPTKDANLSRVQIIRSFPTPCVINVNLKKFFRTGHRENLPTLNPGDMVQVNRTSWGSFKEFTHWLTETSLLVGIYLQLYNIYKEIK